MSRQISLFKRLRVCFAWQWRTSMVKTELAEFASNFLEVAGAFVLGAIGVSVAMLYPLGFIWRYTGQIVFCAVYAKDKAIFRLEEILLKQKRNSTHPKP